MSQRPGMRYLPVAFTTWALRGVVIEALFPTSLIRPFVMSTVASVRGAPPVTSITVTWVRARGAGGRACCGRAGETLERIRTPAESKSVRMTNPGEGFLALRLVAREGFIPSMQARRLEPGSRPR